MLEILRKQFHDTWGREPKATHDNFIARNDPDPEDAPRNHASRLEMNKPIEAYSDEELERRISKLEAHRLVFRRQGH